MKSTRKDKTFLTILILVGSVLLIGALAGGVAASETHNVVPSESIQDAINDADEGDTIVIAEGVYDESIVVNQSDITIIADEGVELSPSTEDPAVTVNNSVENILIQNLNVNSSDATTGYLLTENVNNVTVEASNVSLDNVDSGAGYNITGAVSDVTLNTTVVEKAGNQGVVISNDGVGDAPTDIEIDRLSVQDVGGQSVAINNTGDNEISDVSINATELSADNNDALSILAYGADSEISDISVTNTTVEGDETAITTLALADATVRDISLDNISATDVGTGISLSANFDGTVTDVYANNILANESDTGLSLFANDGGTVNAVHATNILANDSDIGASLFANTDPGDETAEIADITIEESVMSGGDTGISANAVNSTIDGLNVDGVLLEDNQDYGIVTEAAGDATISNVDVQEVLAAGSGTGFSAYGFDESSIAGISIGGDDLDSAAGFNETNDRGINLFASDQASISGLSFENVSLEDVSGTGAQIFLQDSATIDDLEFSTLLAAGSDRGIAFDAVGDSSLSNVSIGGDDLDSAVALNETINTGLSVSANDDASVTDLSLENVLLEEVGGTGAQVSSQDNATVANLEFSTLLAAGSDRGLVFDASGESTLSNVSIGGDDLDSAAALNETNVAGLSVNANDHASVTGLSLEYVLLEDVNGTGAHVSSQDNATIDDAEFSTLLAAGSDRGLAFDASGESSISNLSFGGDDLDSAAALNETETGLDFNAIEDATIESIDLEYVLIGDVNGSGMDIFTADTATVNDLSLSSVLAAGSEEGIDVTAAGESVVSNISIGGDDMDSAVALNETETGLALNAFEDATIESVDSEFVLLEDVNGSGVAIFTADTATVADVSFEMVLAAGSEDGITAFAFGQSSVTNISVQESGLNETTNSGLFVLADDEAVVEELHLDTVDLTGSGVGVQTIAAGDSHIADLDVNRVFVDGDTHTGVATIAHGGTITGTTIQESFLNHTEGMGVLLSADDGGTIADTDVEELLLMNNEGEGVAFVTNESSEISGFDAHTVVAENVSGEAIAAFGNGSMDEITFEESLIRNNDVGLEIHSEAEASGIEIRDSVFRANDVAVQNHNEDEILDVRLNWWGHSTGPSGDVVDPVTEKVATGDGDLIIDTDENVHWSPAIGAKAEERDQFRDIPPELDQEIEIEIEGFSVDDPIELEIEGEVISGPASDFVGLSAWERSVLPLRADADDATMTVDIPDTFVRVDEGDAHINRDVAPVYTKGDEINLMFENQAPFANTERVAGEEVKAIVLKGDVDETVEDLLEMDVEDDIEAQLEREFEDRTDIDVDEESGDVVISSDNVSVVEIQELGELDDEGEIATTITPEDPGDYAVLLTTVETGDGIVAKDDELTFNIFNDTAAMIGAEYLMVQETSSTVSPNQTTVSPGSKVTFDIDANLGATETAHTILVFDEEEFADRHLTITDIEVDQADDGDQVIVKGELDLEPFEMTGNLTDDQGLFTFQGAVNGESFSMTAMVTTDGQFEEATFAGNTSHLEAIDPSGAAVTTPGDETTLTPTVGDQADLDPGESRTYTWVHAAANVDNSDIRSTRKGSLSVSEDPVYDLTVNAEDQDGDALEGVDITVENADTVTAQTDADGEATVQLTNNTYQVTGELEGYESDTATVEIDGEDEEVTLVLEEDVDPDPDPTPTPTPPPEPDEFDLTVTVVNQFTEAVEDVTVMVNDEEGTTDADGQITLTLDPGTYTVSAQKDGFIGATETVEIDDEDKSIEIRIIERQPPREVVSQRLNANNASASINVTAGTPTSISLPDFDVGTEDGIAFQRFNMTAIQDLDTVVTFEQSRDVPGDLEEVPTREGGTTFLSVDYDENVPDSVDEVEFTTRVSQDRLDADNRDAGEVSFYRHNGTDWESIDAEVIDEDDDYVYFNVESPGLSVYATSYEEQFEIVDWTVEPTELMVDETANVSVTVENVGADEETFVGDLMIDDDVVATQEVDIEPNETATLNYTHTFEQPGEFDVLLNNEFLDTVTVEAEDHMLTVTVEDEAGQPIEGADVTVDDQLLTTGADGTVIFDLPDGDYEVTATHEDYLEDSADVTIDGADEEVTLTLEEVVDTFELAVTVEDETGEPLSGATVSVDGLEETTDDDGLATFELEDGEYTVDAELEGYEPDSVDVTIDGADEEVTLTLEEVVETYELAVTVEDTDGDAIEDATVSVDGVEETTDADGVATFELEDGDYTVTADHDDYEEASVDVTIDGADEEVTITLEEDELLPTWAVALLILLLLAVIAAAAYYFLRVRES